MIWGLGSYAFRLNQFASHDNQSIRGYSLHHLPEIVEEELHRIDSLLPDGNNLFVSPDLEALLAIQHN
jgi:hypothetical protein